VNGNEPPFLITYALSDTLIPMQASEAFAAKLEEAGGDVTLKLMEAWHGHFPTTRLRPMRTSRRRRPLRLFLRKCLGSDVEFRSGSKSRIIASDNPAPQFDRLLIAS
jgi:acetyl esterase/lipase